MIEIWEPRYRDRKVLLAKYRVKNEAEEKGVKIKITKGAYKGVYFVPIEVINNSAEEIMKTKAGADIEMIAVSLERIEKQ